MNHLRFISVFISCFFLCSFNWKKCEEFRRNKRNFIAPTASISSSTSFFSSTGACAMIGKVENDAKVFVVQNRDKLLNDIARGNGEYSQSFAAMFGCDTRGRVAFTATLKKNYDLLFKLEKSDLREFYNVLKFEIDSLRESNESCNVISGNA